jgi:hypothetical protein
MKMAANWNVSRALEYRGRLLLLLTGVALLTACPILSTNEEANVATRSSALPGIAGDLTR